MVFKRGSVMIEFVFCLPIFAGLLSLIFFFGWSLVNQQHEKVVAHYSAWKQLITPNVITPQQINQDFFTNRAQNIEIQYENGPTQTLQDFVDEINNPDAQLLAEELVFEKFSQGMKSRVSAEFPPSFSFWQRFQGPIISFSSREGVEWRRGQAGIMEATKDQFMLTLDDTLNSLQGSAFPLGQMMRSLYLEEW